MSRARNGNWSILSVAARVQEIRHDEVDRIPESGIVRYERASQPNRGKSMDSIDSIRNVTADLIGHNWPFNFKPQGTSPCIPALQYVPHSPTNKSVVIIGVCISLPANLCSAGRQAGR